jgi:DHA1 family bicyclomycin/chloramphenicol resistance-like MFS transporter
MTFPTPYTPADSLGFLAHRFSRRLLRRFGARRILWTAAIANALASGLLLGSVVTGIGGFAAQALLLFATMSLAGLIYPNVTALALAPFHEMAGNASALLGTIQYALGAVAGAAVGLLQSATAVPMAAVMAGCGVLGFVAVLGSGKG